MRNVFFAVCSSALVAAFARCSNQQAVSETTNASDCTFVLDGLAKRVSARDAAGRLAYLDANAPASCRDADAFRVLRSASLADVGQMRDAHEELSRIDLETTLIPRALEMAFIFSAEGGWKATVSPMVLAQRYVEISPESPVGFVMLARELSKEGRDDEVFAAISEAKSRVTRENEDEFIAHAVNLSGFYIDKGDDLEAYRLAYSLFRVYRDQAWEREGGVSAAAHAAILVGRRDEAEKIMDEYSRRNPHQRFSAYRLQVLAEIARPTIQAAIALPKGEPTISRLLWPESHN